MPSVSLAGPPGATLTDSAGRTPSEIPSQTQSVSAFLPGKVSMGTPFLRRITLQGMPPLPVSLQLIKNRKATGRLQTCRLNASLCSVSCADNYCPRPTEDPLPLLFPPPAPNRLHQVFVALAVNRIWVGDLTGGVVLICGMDVAWGYKSG